MPGRWQDEPASKSNNTNLKPGLSPGFVLFLKHVHPIPAKDNSQSIFGRTQGRPNPKGQNEV